MPSTASNYVPQARDTSVEIDRMMMDLYRRMEPWEKLQKIADLGRLAFGLAAEDVRRTHPAAGPDEVRLRVAARVYGREVICKAFGWDPGEATP